MRAYHTYLFTLNETTEGGEMLDLFMQNFYGEVESWYEDLEAEDKAIVEEFWTRLHHMFKRKGVYFNELDVDFDLSNPTQYIAYLHYYDSEIRIDDLIQTIKETKDKYLKLIKTQKTLENQILNDIQSESEHYFNDTPQTSDSGINNNYTSTYSKDITKLNIGPVSAKLEEVRLAMQDYYEQWTREFRKFILLSED